MRNKKTLGVRADLVDDPIIFFENELQLIIVHLEFVLLKQDNFSCLRNVNANPLETFSFSDKSKDLGIKVDIELVVIWVSNYECSLQPSFCLLDLGGPFLSPKVLKREKSVANSVIFRYNFS